jgi:hypothetical protein
VVPVLLPPWKFIWGDEKFTQNFSQETSWEIITWDTWGKMKWILQEQNLGGGSGHMNPETPPHYISFKSHFNIVLPSTPRFPKPILLQNMEITPRESG